MGYRKETKAVKARWKEAGRKGVHGLLVGAKEQIYRFYEGKSDFTKEREAMWKYGENYWYAVTKVKNRQWVPNHDDLRIQTDAWQTRVDQKDNGNRETTQKGAIVTIYRQNQWRKVI